LAVLPRGPGLLRDATALSLGLVICALITFAAGVLHILPWGLIPLFAGFLGLQRSEPGPRWRAWPESRVFALIALGLTLLGGLSPAIESDGLRYHLFGPQEYLKAGGIVHLPHHAFTNLPFQQQMLNVVGIWLGGMRTPQLLHWLHLPLAMAFTAALCERLLRAYAAATRSSVKEAKARRACLAAGVAAGCAPVFLVLASWPFVDLATCAYVVGATWALCPGSLPRLRSRLLLAGIFAGAAVGTKLTAVIPGTMLGIVALAAVARHPRPVRVLAAYVIPAVVIASPWFARNIAWHGNPFYPAAWHQFGGEEWDAQTDVFYKSKAAEKGIGRSPLDLILSPLDASIRWEQRYESPEHFRASREGGLYGGLGERLWSLNSPGLENQNPGPAALALVPIAFIALGWGLLKRPRSIALWLAASQGAVGWLAWFSTYQSVRFLLAPLAVLSATAVAALWTASRGRSVIVRPTLAALAGLGIAWTAWYLAAVNPRRPLGAALGFIPTNQYIGGSFSAWPAVTWLNAHADPDEKVLYIGEHRGAYARYEAELSDWFDLPLVLAEIRGTETNEEMLSQWRSRGVRYVLYNQRELDMYREAYFRTRFTSAEWVRFEGLLGSLSRMPATELEEGLFIYDLAPSPSPEEKSPTSAQ